MNIELKTKDKFNRTEKLGILVRDDEIIILSHDARELASLQLAVVTENDNEETDSYFISFHLGKDVDKLDKDIGILQL